MSNSDYSIGRKDINDRRERTLNKYKADKPELPLLRPIRTPKIKSFKLPIRKGITYLYKDGEIIGMEKN